MSIQLYSRKVMNRVLGLPNEHENPIQTPLSEWDFQSCARSEAECADGRDVGQQKIFKTCIVGNIKKNGCGLSLRL